MNDTITSKRAEVLSDLEGLIEGEINWLRTLELNKGKMSVEEYKAQVEVSKRGIKIYEEVKEKILTGKLFKMKTEAPTYEQIEGAETLDFSTNWNKKLDCDFFTTLRLLNASKYAVGKKYNVFLKKEFHKPAECVAVREIMISQLNEFVCGLDTGYSVQETKDILQKMYKVDWSTQKLALVLLKTIKPQKATT